MTEAAAALAPLGARPLFPCAVERCYGDNGAQLVRGEEIGPNGAVLSAVRR